MIVNIVCNAATQFGFLICVRGLSEMIRKCKLCKQDFTNTKNNALYCSERCRNAAKTLAAQKRRGERAEGSKKCNYCGRWFLPVDNEKCCSTDHKEKYKNHVKKWNESNKANYDSKPAQKPDKSNKYISPISTREQESLNKKIHIKLSPTFDPGRSLSKDEINAIAGQLRPPELIPNRHYSFSGVAFMETRFEG